MTNRICNTAGKRSRSGGDPFAEFCRWVGLSTNDRSPLFVELCAGSAALSAAVAESGITVLAFDCNRNRHQTLTKVHNLDLLLDESWEMLDRSFGTWVFRAVHAAGRGKYNSGMANMAPDLSETGIICLDFLGILNLIRSRLMPLINYMRKPFPLL